MITPKLIKLSKREQEILDLISDGFNTKEIASILFISMNTVESHRRNLLIKTGARNAAQLIKIAFIGSLLTTSKIYRRA